MDQKWPEREQTESEQNTWFTKQQEMFFMIYDLQQSYRGRQLIVQQLQVSGTYEDGDNRGLWALSISPRR